MQLTDVSTTSVLSFYYCDTLLLTTLKSDEDDQAGWLLSCFVALSENSKPPTISSSSGPSRFASSRELKLLTNQRHHRCILLQPVGVLQRGALCRSCPSRCLHSVASPSLRLRGRRIKSPVILSAPSAAIADRWIQPSPLAVRRPLCASACARAGHGPPLLEPCAAVLSPCPNPPRRVRLPLPSPRLASCVCALLALLLLRSWYLCSPLLACLPSFAAAATLLPTSCPAALCSYRVLLGWQTPLRATRES